MKSIAWFNLALIQSGGGERLSLEVVRSLRELGHKAEYITYAYDSKATFDGHYDFLNPIYKGKQYLPSSNKFIGFVRRLKKLIWLRQKFKHLGLDYVVTSGTWGHVIDVYLATRFTNIKYVTHVFGSMFAFAPDKESCKYGLVFRKNFNKVRKSVPSYIDVVPPIAPPRSISERIFLEISAYLKYRAVRSSEIVYVLSERNRMENQLLYGKDSHVLQGAFPLRIFDYVPHRTLKKNLASKDEKIVLSVGRLVQNKRVDLAIKSFAEVLRTHPNTLFVIGGTGPELVHLETLAAQIGLKDKVRFIGYVPEKCLWDYLSDCDAFLHLDLADFDIAPLEALAVGANVIWSNEMDLPDLTRELSCLWSVQPDPVSIADAISQAFQFETSRITKEERRRILEPYTWESFASRMIESMECHKCGKT
jgi:glycosyltransferase involved in cell wall biosynthesis